MPLECASFTLRTADLPTFVAGANQYGSSNNSSHSSFTWLNVNIKSILGTMWDEYDYFNLALVSSLISTGAPTYATNDNKIGLIYMSGPKWINSSYDVILKSLTNNACIGIMNVSTLSATVGVTSQYNQLNINTFSKGAPNMQMTIFYSRVSDNLSNATSSGTFPASTFTFKIYGIPKAESSYKDISNKNNQRILL